MNYSGEIPPSPTAPATEDALSIPFPTDQSPPPSDPCSFNECLSGHKWPAALAIAKCPGCAGGLLAVQKSNCPFCNEPIDRTVLRSDFLPRGASISARCRGAAMQGDSLDIDMKRTSWADAESKPTNFLQREAEERAAHAARSQPSIET